MVNKSSAIVANNIVKCLENEGVEYIFGIPGEENIRLVDATVNSKIRFILVRHEQGASFMADIYGRLTGKAGVCAATLGPGAINLIMGVTDAQTNSSPLVAISAQVGINRIYKESHQLVDLVQLFKPITKWADIVLTPAAVPEMVRKAFAVAQGERPGSTYLAIPEDVEAMPQAKINKPLSISPSSKPAADETQIEQAVKLIKKAKKPIILAGQGIARDHAEKSLLALCDQLNVPVATSFMGKGVISDRYPNALGVIGFMRHDYENFAFDSADLIIAIGYELQEFAPSRINPNGDKKIIHINSFAEDIDVNYQISVNIVADIEKAVDLLTAQLKAKNITFVPQKAVIKDLVAAELDKGAADNSYPLKPQRIVSDVRKALSDDDIVLADTGAIKMWMARLYPTYQTNTCLIGNGLSPMSFALPGALGAHLAKPTKKVLATMGDGSFMMNSQEIETAVRENIPLVVLIWEDKSYGLIKWKMDMEIGHYDNVDFSNPDFVKYAESFGAKGYRIKKAEELLPTLKTALASTGVHIITCPVDYSENMKLTNKLGELTISL